MVEGRLRALHADLDVMTPEECRRIIKVLVSHGLVKDGVKAESRPKTALKDWLTSGGILEKEAA